MSKFFLHRLYDADSKDILIVFSSQMEFDEVAFDNVIQQEIDGNLSPDAIVVYARQTQVAALSAAGRGGKIQSLVGRLSPTTSMCVQPFDLKGKALARFPLIDGRSCYERPLEFLKIRALTSIFRSRGGLVEAGPGYHFRNPSGRHTDRFMRLSNVLVDPAEISFFAYCLLPFIGDDVRNIYVDTPALFPLVAAVNDHFRGLGVNRHIECDSFGSYDGIQNVNLVDIDKSMFLISASSSGSLARKIKERFGTYFDPVIVSAVYLGEAQAGGEVLCNLKHSKDNPDGFDLVPQNNTDHDCALCRDNSVVIRLRGDRFELTGPPPNPVMITQRDAPPGLDELMSRFVGRSAFAIGLAESGELKRPLYIDFDNIISTEEYADVLRRTIVSSFPNAATCIVCVDEGSKLFASKILEYAGSAPSSVPIINRSELSSEISRSDSCHVVVVANVIESGRSLLEVSRDLRLAYPKAAQSYYIGFAKVESKDKIRTLRNTLVKTSGVQPHSFISINEMILPPSGTQSSWSKERSLLRRAGREVRLTVRQQTALDQRRNFLDRGSIAPRDEIFLSSATNRSLFLNPGFVFWPLETTVNNKMTQADVYYTVSSILQSLRANGRSNGAKSIRNEYFVHNVLDPAVFGRFNDGIIQASFLRASLPHELDYSESAVESREASRIIRRVLLGANGASGAAAPEFLLALALGTLTLRPNDFRTCLEGLKSQNPMMSALIKLAGVRANS